MCRALLEWRLGLLPFVVYCWWWYVEDLFSFQSWSLCSELLDIILSTQKGTLNGIHVISIPFTDNTDHLQKCDHWSKASGYSEWHFYLKLYGVFPLSDGLKIFKFVWLEEGLLISLLSVQNKLLEKSLLNACSCLEEIVPMKGKRAHIKIVKFSYKAYLIL